MTTQGQIVGVVANPLVAAAMSMIGVPPEISAAEYVSEWQTAAQNEAMHGANVSSHVVVVHCEEHASDHFFLVAPVDAYAITEDGENVEIYGLVREFDPEDEIEIPSEI